MAGVEAQDSLETAPLDSDTLLPEHKNVLIDCSLVSGEGIAHCTWSEELSVITRSIPGFRG